LAASCGESGIDRDRPREVLTWSYPDDFQPSHVTADDTGARWGLFVSRRYSGKDNFWAVRSTDGAGWQDPVLLMNAYYSEQLRFESENGVLRLIFTNIDEDYFWDYEQFLQDTLPFPSVVTAEFEIADLLMDNDRDNLPDRLESELLLSVRLPDSDIDGKRDDVDFCPLAVPIEHAERFEIYREAVMTLMQLDDPEKLRPIEDTAWTRFYGVYYMHEPTVVYLAMPGETHTPELMNLPIVAVQRRSSLHFTSKQLYDSYSGGVIPHLVLERPKLDFIGDKAEMDIKYVTHKYRRELATIHFSKTAGKWKVESVTKDD
jgi:hypothetical protein